MTQEVIGINIAASRFQYVKRKIDGLHKTQTVEKVHNGNKSIFYIGSTLHITTLYEGCIRVNGLGNLTYEGEKKLCLVRETKGTKDMLGVNLCDVLFVVRISHHQRCLWSMFSPSR